MATLSVNETTTFRWSFEEDAVNYAAAGIPAMGVWRQKLSDFGEEKGIELLAEVGLKVSHLLWVGGFTGNDGRSFRASLEDAKDALETAAELKAETLVIYSGSRAGHTANHARRLIRDALKDLAPVASERGVVLGIEPMHPNCAAQFTFLTGIDDTLDLLQSVGSPQVKMVFDTYHLGQDRMVIDRIAELAGKVALVQLGDSRDLPTAERNRCRLGEGRVPLREIVEAFKAAGYDGFYDVELLGEEIETLDYRCLLTHAREAFDQIVLRSCR
jgi:sugar phosphate isomerase/epimerase